MKFKRYTAASVLKLIEGLEQPVNWRNLAIAAEAIAPKEITQLRQVLRGLERNGELNRSVDGGYLLEAPGDMQVATVQKRGRVFYVAGLEIEGGAKLSLRSGDEVGYVVAGELARVQEVVAFNPDPVAGVLQTDGRFPYVEAIGGMRGRISVSAKDAAQAMHGETVSVQVTGRERHGLVGHILSKLAESDVLTEAISTALVAHQIPHEWPDAVFRAAEKLPKSVQTDQFPKRVDLTDLPLVTIDGETAKDFDDAVYAHKTDNGWRLVVAIADVAHYVKLGSALDSEAVVRGTSVYFPERVVPMLPEAISNGLCSLRPETPRLALVCDMTVTKGGAVAGHKFYEAVIYSHARLTYTEVQRYLDGGKKGALDVADETITDSIKSLASLHRAFAKARDKRGALDFPTHEGVFQIEKGRIKKITPVERIAAHQLIEEAMIAANVCAAQFLEKSGLGGLYRVHEPPEHGRLEELRQALAYAGVRLAAGDVSPHQMQEALSKLPDSANKWLFGQLALRTMQQAIYTPNNNGHYGLALEHYMHFTSPIRRYPDLVVHRLIKAVLNKKSQGVPNADELVWLGETCSSNERRAESAGWMVDGWLKCDFLEPRIGETFRGTIATVTEFGLFVELEGYFVQGLVHISNLGGDYFVYHSRSQSLVGEKSGRRFSMGDSLEVVLEQVQPAQGQVDLVLEGERVSNQPAKGGKKQSPRYKGGATKAGAKKTDAKTDDPKKPKKPKNRRRSKSKPSK
jgi:ribonuclease R